ncbi:DgyrCDS7339 [Dimorphilus gyrociliatus]|uniref:DgyrCDS7339 n=1 Tax=Dimorphilus gyrociliatus TaxID=2664684 RepID=A0A7I8VSE5_9ANNE|nr:DgyrCDS7339 [Dimorphilus gyrociliatus]
MDHRFSVLDYALFATTLVISLSIGLFSAFRKRKENTTGEYLMGGRKLQMIPVSLSILVTYVSAIGILGTPAEIYTYGTQFSLQILAMMFGNFFGAFLFVPLFYPLKLTSCLEYYTLRYKENYVKYLNIMLLTLISVLVNGIGVFAPSVALQGVTGLPSYISIIACTIVGTIYTTFGGMNAVIWTDVFQCCVILAGLITVLVKGIISVGGFKRMWEINDQYGRIEFFKSIILTVPFFGFISTASTLCGMAAFAYYAFKGCDPLASRLIYDPNQILPLFVMELMGYSGIPGLFVACLFSASLSTLSSGLNSLAAVFWESVVQPRYPNIEENKAANVNKLIVCFFGIIVLGFAIGFQYVKGTLIEILFSVIGFASGPMCASILSSASFPWVSAKASFISCIVSLAFVFWMNIGSLIYRFTSEMKPSPIYNCSAANVIRECMNVPGINLGMLNGTIYEEALVSSNSYYDLNSTLAYCKEFISKLPKAMPVNKPKGFQHFYAVTYLYYSAIGIFISVLVSSTISLIPALRCKHYVKDRYLFVHIRMLRRFINKYRTGKEYPYGSCDLYDEKGDLILTDIDDTNKELLKEKNEVIELNKDECSSL